MGGKQLGFSDSELSTAKKQTKREKFLSALQAVVPWQALIDRIEPHYPEGRRDPEMHQTKKGNQWYYGMNVKLQTNAGVFSSAVSKISVGRDSLVARSLFTLCSSV
jgi:hypothetical protein